MDDNKKSFLVFRENEQILVFKFVNLTTKAAQEWGTYILKYNGHYPDPLRLLYDLSDCGDSPSRYFLKYMDEIVPKLITPQNSRYAYLLPNQNFAVWSTAFFSRTVAKGQTRSFLGRDEAVNWLMESLEEKSANENSAQELEAKSKEN